MIPGGLDQSDNETIEKYCYKNEPDSCDKYGGLYQWNEMMQYAEQEGSQGICPPGWHVATDEEWKVLAGAADSLVLMGALAWDSISQYHGYDAGTNLKSDSCWSQGENGTNLFEFRGMPGGIRGYGGIFSFVSKQGHWWTSTRTGSESPWARGLSYSSSGISRFDSSEEFGHSVRCIKDY
jgi:uncharacterized protein (TIGR02145 family)